MNYVIDDSGEFPCARTLSGAYIGNENTARFLCEERGVVPELIKEAYNVCSIGFNSKTQEWHGWSHRAIYAFGIGSKVNVGDCAYVADTPGKLIESHVAFWADGGEARAKLARDECQVLDDGSGIRILHAPMVVPMLKDINDLSDAIDGTVEMEDVDIAADAVTIIKCGRGEWTAETIEDAKEMAVAFAESVS